MNAVVCSKKKKGDKKLEERTKKGLDRADIVRDYRLADLPGGTAYRGSGKAALLIAEGRVWIDARRTIGRN